MTYTVGARAGNSYCSVAGDGEMHLVWGFLLGVGYFFVVLFNFQFLKNILRVCVFYKKSQFKDS